MRYADPAVCAGCRKPLAEDLRCRWCGLDLSTPDGGRVWLALQAVDQALVVARAAGEHATPEAAPAPTVPPSVPAPEAPDHQVAASGGMTTGLPPAPPPPGQAPPTAAPRAPRRHIGAGTVILALGALALLVAGAIFITVYWGPMGVLGRALVLLGLTAVVGVTGHLVTARRLRASAEALWTVFLGFFALDWFQARAQGLLGLDALDASAWTIGWTVLTVATAVLVVRSGRRRLDDGVELVTVSVIGGLSAWVGGVALAEIVSSAGATVFWSALPAGVLALAAAAALHRGSARLGAWVAAAAAATAGSVAVVAAVVEAVVHPSLDELVTGGHGVPLALLVAATTAAAVTARPGPTARTVAAGLAASGAVLLAALPTEDAWPARGGVLVCAAVAAALTWVRGPAGPARGLRAAAVVPLLVAAGALVPWAGELGSGLDAALTTRGGYGLGHRLEPLDVPGVGPAWLGAALGVLVCAALLGTARWKVVAPVRQHAPAVVTALALVLATSILVSADPPALALSLAVSVSAVLVWFVAERTGAARWPGWWWACAAVIALAPVLAMDSWWACVITWPLAAAALLLAARRQPEPLARGAAVLSGAVWSGGAVGALVLALDGPGEVLVGVLLASGLAMLVLAALRVPDVAARTGAEAAAVVVAGASFLLSDSRATTLQVAVSWCVVALVLAVLAGTRHGRRTPYLGVSAVAALVAVGLTVGDWPSASWLWPVATTLLVLAAVQARERLVRDVGVAAAVGVGIASALPVLELTSASDRTSSLVLLAAAVVTGLLGSRLLQETRGRLGAEAAAVAWAAAAVAYGAGTTSTAWTALLLTVLGSALVIGSLVVADRRWLRLPGSAALGLAYVLRLVASDVDVVEAYTLPFAVLLLAAGVWALVRPSAAAPFGGPERWRSWGGESVVALSPGLVLGLLPSLPQALDEPTSVRGVLLGLVALAILVAGVVLRWKALFVAGAVVLGLVLLVQLGPVAIAVPRWVVIAVVGVTFLVVGATWESRVRDGRAAVRWVGAMR